MNSKQKNRTMIQSPGGYTMRIKQISLIVASLVVALLALATALTVLAGSTDSPAVPGSTSSHTLEHIYNRINDGTTVISTTFTEPSSGPPTGTMHTLDEIYDLVGERAQVPKTGQTKCYDNSGEQTCPVAGFPGQDGDHQKGVAWPSTRFITSTTGIVTDTLTGLIWLENANCAIFFSGDSTGQNYRSWANALTAANSLANGYCGLTDDSSAGDWRLPNVRELFSLSHFGQAYSAPWLKGQGFSDVQSGSYWSSTTPASWPPEAYHMFLDYGTVSAVDKSINYSVWPVRGGQ